VKTANSHDDVAHGGVVHPCHALLGVHLLGEILRVESVRLQATLSLQEHTNSLVQKATLVEIGQQIMQLTMPQEVYIWTPGMQLPR